VTDNDSDEVDFLMGLLWTIFSIASAIGAVLLLLKRMRLLRWMGRKASLGVWYYVMVAGAVAIVILLFKVAASPPYSAADRLMRLVTVAVFAPMAAAGVVLAFLKP
jgi:uncharacterized membrane protein